MMFRYKDYMKTETGQKARFTKFYKEFLTLLSKYGYSGSKIGCYNVYDEINKMREEVLKRG